MASSTHSVLLLKRLLGDEVDEIPPTLNPEAECFVPFAHRLTDAAVAERRERENHYKELEHYVKELEQAEEALTSKLADTRTHYNCLYKEQEKQINTLNRTVSELRQDISTLELQRGKWSSLEEHNVELRDQLQGAKERIEALEQEVSMMREKIQDVYDIWEHEIEETQEHDPDPVHERVSDLRAHGFLSSVYIQNCPVVCAFNPSSVSHRYPAPFVHFFASCANLCVAADMKYHNDERLIQSVLEAQSNTWSKHHTVQACWMQFRDTWIGAAGCASSTKCSKQAFAMVSKLVECAMSHNLPEHLRQVRDALPAEHVETFSDSVQHLRVALAYILLDVPDPPWLVQAKEWMLQKAQLLQHRLQRHRCVDAHVPAVVIRWTQDDVSFAFRARGGQPRRSVHLTAMDIWRQGGCITEATSQIPSINVVLDSRGLFWSLDNRRLLLYKLLQASAADVVMVSCRLYRDHPELESKMHTSNDGMGVTCYRPERWP